MSQRRAAAREGVLDRAKKFLEGIDVEKRAAAGVFGYPAGKSIIVDKLTPMAPARKTYTELFCGSAAMFFKLEKVDVEVLNDLDPDVAQVYRNMQAFTDADLAALAKREWKGSKATWSRLRNAKPSGRVDQVHKFLYLTRFSYGRLRGKSWDPNSDGVLSKMAGRVEMARDRLKGVKIFSEDYANLLTKFDGKDAFHFLDPPYAGYDVGIGEKKFDEAKFREVLKSLKGKFLVTYGVKGKLDTSGFHVKRLRQERTIRAMRGVSQDKYLTHLLVSNYEISKRDIEKALGDGWGVEDVDAILDVSGARTRVFLSAGSSVSADGAAALAAYEAPSDASFSLVRGADGQVAARLQGLGGAAIDWTIDLGRAGASAPLERLTKGFSVHGDRFLLPLAKGAPAAPGAPAWAGDTEVLQRPALEMGLQVAGAQEYFVTKGSWGEPVLLGRLEVLKAGAGWQARIDQEDLVPRVLKAGAPMPPDGISALPASLEAAVPRPYRYWKSAGDEARLQRDALVASGMFGPGSVRIVDGVFARVVTKVFLADPPAKVAKADGEAGWELVAIKSLLPEGAKLQEVFGPVRKKMGEGEVAYVDTCDVEDAAGLRDVVDRAMKMDGEFVLGAIDAPAAREVFAKVGRPLRFIPGGSVGIDAARRLFVTSFGVQKSDAFEWVDLDKAVFHNASTAVVSSAVSEALREKYPPPKDQPYCGGPYISDLYDDSAVYEHDGSTWRIGYTFDRGSATLTGEPEQVMRTYEPVGKDFSDSRAERAWRTPFTKREIPILKTADERYVLGVVLVPDEEDAQHDVYSAEEVKQAAHRYMEKHQNLGFMHKKVINDRTKIVESYLAPCDFDVGGEKVKKGTWLLAQHVTDDALWKMIKSGEITGLSIGGSAQRTPTGKNDGTKKTVDYQGLEIRVDRPKGFVQQGTGADGKTWSRTYKVDYGEIPGTLGGDGEGLDVFIGPQAKSRDVYWAIQSKADGSFDEYKLVVGTADETAARAIYTDHIPPRFLVRMAKTSIDMVKALRGIEPREVLKRLREELGGLP